MGKTQEDVGIGEWRQGSGESLGPPWTEEHVPSLAPASLHCTNPLCAHVSTSVCTLSHWGPTVSQGVHSALVAIIKLSLY
jgi:hypothetical protein